MQKMSAQKSVKKGTTKPTGTKGKVVPTKAATNKAKSPEKSTEPTKDNDKKTNEVLTGIKCSLRDIDKVLLKDESNEIRDSGRWPLLIDLNGQAATFLRYRDTNYLCTANSNDMQAERVRKALVGAISRGKAVVIDMLDTDMLGIVEKVLNEIQPNLFKDLMSKEIMKDEKYRQLERPDDVAQPELAPQDFTFVLSTTKASPPEDLLKLTFPVRVE